MKTKITLLCFLFIIIFSSCGNKPTLKDISSIYLLNTPAYGLVSEMTSTSIVISNSGEVEISTIQLSTEEVVSTKKYIISEKEYSDLVKILIDNKFFKLEKDQPYNGADCPFYNLTIETSQETYLIKGSPCTDNKSFDNIVDAIFSISYKLNPL